MPNKLTVLMQANKKQVMLALLGLMVLLVVCHLLKPSVPKKESVPAPQHQSSNVTGLSQEQQLQAKLDVLSQQLNTAKSQVDIHSNQSLANKLDDISGQLKSLQANLNQQNVSVDIQNQLDSIVSEISNLINSGNTSLSQQLQNSSQSLTSQLSDLKSTLNTVATQSSSGSLLDSSLLPYSVISIDTIQSQNVVTVRYGNRLTPLEIGDSLAGWTLTQADFSNQSAEFSNEKKQRIDITLNNLAEGQ